MDAQPGWYDAGVSGRQRWWDGQRWTEHERSAVGSSPGWYAVPGGSDLRWWEGRYWTEFRIRGGRFGVEGASVEQPAVPWVLGPLFLAVGGLQLAMSSSLGSVSTGTGVLFLALGVIWLAIGARTAALRRAAPPAGVAFAGPLVRPLPGEQEGAGAGWYPVSSRGARWWTGLRWTEYVHTRSGIRPTFLARRALRILWIGAAVFFTLGVVGTLTGILLLAFGRSEGIAFFGISVLAIGLVFVLVGVFLLVSARLQSRLLLFPKKPPTPPAS